MTNLEEPGWNQAPGWYLTPALSQTLGDLHWGTKPKGNTTVWREGVGTVEYGGMWSASTLTEVAHFGVVILPLLYCFYSPCVNIKISNGRYPLLLHISQGHWHPKCERLDLCLQAWSSITQLQTLSDAGRLTAKSGPMKALNRPVCGQARCGAQICVIVLRFHCVPTQDCALYLRYSPLNSPWP